MIVQGISIVFWILNRYVALCGTCNSCRFSCRELSFWRPSPSGTSASLVAIVRMCGYQFGILVFVAVSACACRGMGGPLSAIHSAWGWWKESSFKFRKDSSTIACRVSFLRVHALLDPRKSNLSVSCHSRWETASRFKNCICKSCAALLRSAVGLCRPGLLDWWGQPSGWHTLWHHSDKLLYCTSMSLFAWTRHSKWPAQWPNSCRSTLGQKKGGRTWQDLNCQIVVLHVTMSCTVKKRIRKLIKHLRCIKVPRTSMYKRNQRYLLAAVCSIVWL